MSVMFRFNRDDLTSTLAVVSKALGRHSIPTLENVYICASGSQAEITADNLEIRITGKCRLVGGVPDRIEALLPRKLVEIVKSMPGAEVEIEIDEGRKATIRSGAVNFTLCGADPDEFPRDENKELVTEFDINDLAGIAAHTCFAANPKDYGFKRGVLFEALEAGDKALRATATDTYRLAEYVCEADFPKGTQFRVLVPAELLQVVARIFGDGEVYVALYQNVICFSDADYAVNCRLLNDKCPNFDGVWAEKHETEVGLYSTAMLENSLQRALLVAPHVELTLRDGKMEISAKSDDGQMRETVELEWMTGQELEMSLWNARYLLEGLKAAGEGNVVLKFNGPSRPCEIAGRNYRCLVMPIRLKS